jgi:hypothetical protein
MTEVGYRMVTALLFFACILFLGTGVFEMLSRRPIPQIIAICLLAGLGALFGGFWVWRLRNRASQGAK